MNWALFGSILACMTAIVTLLGVVVKISSNYTKLKTTSSSEEKRLNEKVEELKISQSVQRSQFLSTVEQMKSENKHELYENINSIKVDIEKSDAEVRKDFENKYETLSRELNEQKQSTSIKLEKLFEAQQLTAETLKEISITMKSIEKNFDQRLCSMENKIDQITTLKLKNQGK